MGCILKFKGIDRHIEDMLENSYIFLQNPKNFNDIFDSKSVQDSYNVITIFCGAGIEEIGNTKLWGVYGDCGKGIVLKYKIPNSKIGYMLNSISQNQQIFKFGKLICNASVSVRYFTI